MGIFVSGVDRCGEKKTHECFGPGRTYLVVLRLQLEHLLAFIEEVDVGIGEGALQLCNFFVPDLELPLGPVQLFMADLDGTGALGRLFKLALELSDARSIV